MSKYKIREVRFKVLQDATLIDPERQTHISVTGQREHVWHLGLGPCGREVESLEYDINVAALTIRQISYPKGYGEAHSAAMKDLNRPRDQQGRPDVLERRNRFYKLLEDCKREHFVYPLETIVGRIRVLEA